MKKLIAFLGILLISLSSYGQLIISQSLTPTTGLKVGDTITVKYTLSKGQVIKNPRYLWFRYQYSNKSLAYVSTTFNQTSLSNALKKASEKLINKLFDKK